MTDATQALTREAWEARYIDERGDLRPAPNDGAVPGQRVEFTDMAEFLKVFPAEVDVLGDPDTEFLTILGGTFDQRSQLPDDASARLHLFTLTGHLPSGWSLEIGTTAPLFGRSGGARYVTIRSANGVRRSVFELLDTGVLVERAGE
jgi:hypothetical protein